jgi:hypothetical protein
MALVQIAHGWHERNGLAGPAPATNDCAQLLDLLTDIHGLND